MKFCNQCGEALAIQIPPGDDRERFVCPACATVHYVNPKIITGCIPTYENSILLCRRAIEPAYGLWTLPAGFLEQGESIAEGAQRESYEEARANLTIDELYAIYDVTHIGQVHVFYRATLQDLNFQPGPESLETQLFREEEIPWQELAFPVTSLVLRSFFDDRRKNLYTLRTATIDRNFRKPIES
jgi:ADP-ribose pyrophosphatase YjhB (NUDIX family)